MDREGQTDIVEGKVEKAEQEKRKGGWAGREEMVEGLGNDGRKVGSGRERR